MFNPVSSLGLGSTSGSMRYAAAYNEINWAFMKKGVEQNWACIRVFELLNSKL